MKIGILTLPPHTNYGGILQAWALQKILRDLGYQPQILMPPQTSLKTYWKSYLKRMFLKVSGRYDQPVFAEVIARKNAKYITKFKDSYLNYYRISDFNNFSPGDFSAFVVGSDQIWREIFYHHSWGGNFFNSFLAFSKDWSVNRISYAASFGLDNWQFDENATKEITRLLSKFNRISVREFSAVNLIKEHLKLPAELCLDPTLLINSSDYFKYLNIPSFESGTLVSYILDPSPENESIVNSISESKNLTRIELNRNVNKEKLFSVEEWIGRIASADLVITNSFHGCVFSIIFRRPLIFMGNKIRGNARFESLINLFDLGNNRIETIEDFDINSNYSLPPSIDNKLSDLQHKSLTFLKEALNYNN